MPSLFDFATVGAKAARLHFTLASLHSSLRAGTVELKALNTRYCRSPSSFSSTFLYTFLATLSSGTDFGTDLQPLSYFFRGALFGLIVLCC